MSNNLKEDKIVTNFLDVTENTYNAQNWFGKTTINAADGCFGIIFNPIEVGLTAFGSLGIVGGAVLFIATIVDPNLQKYATPENLSGLGKEFISSVGMLGVGKLMEIARKIKIHKK